MKNFSIKEAITYGWELFKKHKKLLVLSALIFLILTSLHDGSDRYDIGLVIGLVLFGVSILIHIGWFKLLFHIEKGEPTSLRELFTHTELFWKYLVAYVLYMLIAAIGFVLLIVPGFYFLVKYGFALLLIIDREGISIKEAFQESARMTDGVKWKLLGFLLTLVLVNLLGLICLGVGLLVSIPVTMLAHIYVYRKLSKETAA